jgi:hypothetical protein
LLGSLTAVEVAFLLSITMSHKISISIMAFLLCAAATATTAAATPATASAQEAQVHRGSTPVGLWTGTVSHGGTTGSLQLAFSRTGKACLYTSDGESFGTWARTGDDQFSYAILEPLIDNTTGQQTGWIHINQDAVQERGVFNSSGISVLYDLNGNLIGSVQSSVAVQRESWRVPESC